MDHISISYESIVILISYEPISHINNKVYLSNFKTSPCLMSKLKAKIYTNVINYFIIRQRDFMSGPELSAATAVTLRQM